MRVSRRIPLAMMILLGAGIPLLALAGCGLGFDVPALPAARKATIEQDVRQFVAAVSRDITQQGPAAWEKYLEDSPAFFMADEGKLVFPNRQAARQEIHEFTRTIQRIELTWETICAWIPLRRSLASWQVPGTKSGQTRKDIRQRRTASLPAWRNVTTANGNSATRIGQSCLRHRKRHERRSRRHRFGPRKEEPAAHEKWRS